MSISSNLLQGNRFLCASLVFIVLFFTFDMLFRIMLNVILYFGRLVGPSLLTIFSLKLAFAFALSLFNKSDSSGRNSLTNTESINTNSGFSVKRKSRGSLEPTPVLASSKEQTACLCTDSNTSTSTSTSTSTCVENNLPTSSQLNNKRGSTAAPECFYYSSSCPSHPSSQTLRTHNIKLPEITDEELKRISRLQKLARISADSELIAFLFGCSSHEEVHTSDDMAVEKDCAELVPINELLKQTTLPELPLNSSFGKQARDSLLIRSQSYFKHRHAAVLDMKLIDREPLEIHINLNQISLVEENGIPAKHVTFRLPPDDDESGVLPNFYSDDDDSEDTPNLPIDDDGSEGTPNLPSDDDDAEFMPYLLPVYHPGLSVHNILRAGNEYNVLSRKKKEVWRSVLNFLGFQKKNDKRVKREKNIDYSRSWLDIE